MLSPDLLLLVWIQIPKAELMQNEMVKFFAQESNNQTAKKRMKLEVSWNLFNLKTSWFMFCHQSRKTPKWTAATQKESYSLVLVFGYISASFLPSRFHRFPAGK